MPKPTVGFVFTLLLLPLAGCGNQPTVGPTTVTARIREMCSYGGATDDSLRTALIGIDAIRDSGASKLEALVAAGQSCNMNNSTNFAITNCFNCVTAMIDHVYTH